MRYQADHDLHIHTCLSRCSNDDHQRPDLILEYGQKNGLHTLCITDHYWDEKVPGPSFHGPYVSGASIWYALQDTHHTDHVLPLPHADDVRMLYGCETEMNMHCVLGISPKEMERRDFIVVPTTHLHMKGFTVERDGDLSEKTRAELWIKRLDALLDMDLPFHKIGIAHLTCSLFSAEKAPESTVKSLSLIKDEDMKRLFARVSKCGAGVELNFNGWEFDEGIIDEVLRPYKIAAECGCKFYLGSDAHTRAELSEAPDIFTGILNALQLDETQKFKI